MATSRYALTSSFIHIAKQKGIKALIGPFPSGGGFDSCFVRSMEIQELHKNDGKGTALCSIKVNDDLLNAFGTLHGGATSTIVDIVGTLALLAEDPNRPGVSIELSCSFTRAAPLGSLILAKGTVIKYGKKLGFTQVDLIDASTNHIIASGRHTKAF